MAKLRRYVLIFLALLAIVVPLVFYSSDLKNRKDYSLFERIGYSLMRPIEKLFSASKISAQELLSNYFLLQNAKQTAENLQIENAELKLKISMQKDLANENERLKKLLLFAEQNEMQFVPATAIGADASYVFRSVRLNVGSEHGIEIGMPAVTDKGVVGLVSRVMARTSDVLLINDPNSNLDVVVTRNRRRGIMQGTVAGAMMFRFSERGSRIQVGDEILTSGLTGSLPRGLPVGRVVSVQSATAAQPANPLLSALNVSSGSTTIKMDTPDTSQIVVEPYANPNNLSEILVLKRSSPELALMKRVGGQEWFQKGGQEQ